MRAIDPEFGSAGTARAYDLSCEACRTNRHPSREKTDSLFTGPPNSNPNRTMKSNFLLATLALIVGSLSALGAESSPSGRDTYRLTISVTPTNAATVTLDPQPGLDGTFPAGTVVTVTLISINNFRLLAWLGDASGTSLVQRITLTSDRFAKAAMVQRALPEAPKRPGNLRVITAR
jgi:hypothetical protein